MDYRLLGSSGAVVSRIGLGAMGFGDTPADDVALAELDVFVEAGGTLIDTADVYGDGQSERVVGTWLASRPADITERVVVATKGRYPSWTSGDPSAGGSSRRHLTRALDASLTRLGVETIDLYQVHAWDPHTPIEETLAWFDDAVAAGKVRYCGLSNFTGWQIEKASGRSRSGPVTAQIQYNLLTREVEWEITPAAQDNGLGILAWSPLAGGLLTGKHRRGEEPEDGTRFAAELASGYGAYFGALTAADRTWRVLETVSDIAKQREISPAQVSLAWLLAQPAVTSVIIGARTVSQLRENLGTADIQLDAEEIGRLDTASDPEPGPYPYGVFGQFQRSRMIGKSAPIM